MIRIPNADMNMVDRNPENLWGSSSVWHHKGAVAVGACSAHVQANPDESDDALWAKAEAVAANVFDVHLDTGSPVSDSGLLAAISATMVPMLFAYMQALREQLRYRRFWVEASRARPGGFRRGPAQG